MEVLNLSTVCSVIALIVSVLVLINQYFDRKFRIGSFRPRCEICKNRIWPWSEEMFAYGADPKSTVVIHKKCYARYLEIGAERADQNGQPVDSESD